MKNIKSYEEFSNEETNEEINWKKAAAGVALGASLISGMSSCKKSDIKPVESSIEQSIKQSINVNVLSTKDSIMVQNLTNKDIKIGMIKIMTDSDSTGSNIKNGFMGFFYYKYDVVLPAGKPYTILSNSTIAFGQMPEMNNMNHIDNLKKQTTPDDWIFIELYKRQGNTGQNTDLVKVFSFKQKIGNLLK